MICKSILTYLIVCLISMSYGFEAWGSCALENNRDFVFIRHGKTPWGREDILKGPQNLTLDAEGRQQAQHAYEGLTAQMPIINPVIFSSPLIRAIETADIFSNNIVPKPSIKRIGGLQERYYGDYSKAGDLQRTPEDAESTESFQDRVRKTLAAVLKETPAVDGTLIIVSHQKVFEYLALWLTDQKLSLPQAGFCYFQFNDGSYSIKFKSAT
jgi:broad specificity phosphatase PhoE